jgi:hypothetical protein
VTALIGESQSRPSAPAEPGVSGLGNRPRSPARRWLIWTCLTSLLVVLGLAALALRARAEFGSIPSAVSYLRGARLIPLRYSVQAGSVAQGEDRMLEFKLRNWSSKPVMILGAKSSCTCVSLGDFPIRVLPGGTNNLAVRLRTKNKKPGPIYERVRVYTDEKRSDALVLAVTGVVR